MTKLIRWKKFKQINLQSLVSCKLLLEVKSDTRSVTSDDKPNVEATKKNGEHNPIKFRQNYKN